MMRGYQPGLRSMAGSAAYSLIQRSTRMTTRRAMLYRVSNSFFERYAHLSLRIHTLSLSILQLRSSNLTVRKPFLKNSYGGRSHFFYAATKILLGYYPMLAHISTARPPRVSILDFLSIISPIHNPHNYIFLRHKEHLKLLRINM